MDFLSISAAFSLNSLCASVFGNLEIGRKNERFADRYAAVTRASVSTRDSAVVKFFSCQIKGQAKWKHAPDDEVDTKLAWHPLHP